MIEVSGSRWGRGQKSDTEDRDSGDLRPVGEGSDV